MCFRKTPRKASGRSPRSRRGRRCCSCTARSTILSRCRRCSDRRARWRRPACRWSGTCPRELAMESTARACALAGRSWRGPSEPSAEAFRRASQSRCLADILQPNRIPGNGERRQQEHFVNVAVSPGAWPALVLNADYRPLSYYPLSVWAWQDTIKAVFLERVHTVAHYDKSVRSPSVEIRLPSVVSLKTFVKPARHPAFTRFNVFLRDRFSCQYCGSP